SNLLAIFARSLGIPMSPLWMAHTDPPWSSPSDFMERTTYYPAGRTATESYTFTFHQVGYYAGLVYDPSTRPNLTGDPHIGETLVDYLNSAFPGQVSAGYITLSVPTILIPSPLRSGGQNGGTEVPIEAPGS